MYARKWQLPFCVLCGNDKTSVYPLGLSISKSTLELSTRVLRDDTVKVKILGWPLYGVVYFRTKIIYILTRFVVVKYWRNITSQR